MPREFLTFGPEIATQLSITANIPSEATMIQTLPPAAYLLVPLVGLAALALRLRWQALREQRRYAVLRTIVDKAPADRTIEIDDLRDDGSHLRITITPTDRQLGGKQ